MHYEGNMIRPPSEANSILLQATVGCSHNKCTFCAAYKGVRFKIKPDDIILQDIAYASKHFRNHRRLFICDGDGMIIPQKRLVFILKEIQKQLPWIERVGVYANAKSLSMKSLDELKTLRKLGLKIAYLGLESGDDETLKKVRKKGDSAYIIEKSVKAKKADIKLSVTVLLGLAGRERSQFHAEKTGMTLSAMDPDYVGALSLMLVPGTAMYDEFERKEFEMIEPLEMLKELRTMIAHTHLTDGLFHANHASNYLPIRARLPFDQDRVLGQIDDAINGKIPLKPEYMRAL
ncbi:radical SAM domain-containing protein [Candidatus Magnetomorum sp. HK-1]|nr:radical SAM domain-containing protein [Candidatus Magnetomorum sp. HK-1]